MSQLTHSKTPADTAASEVELGEALDPPEIIPVAALQDNSRAVLARLRETKQPIVLAQDGKPAGVLLDIAEYNELLKLAERGELAEMIARGEEALATGDIVDWEDVKREKFGWLSEQ
jgi:prevent-host-death family protein